MSRLSKLYEAMETLRKEGLPVDEDLERNANEIIRLKRGLFVVSPERSDPQKKSSSISMIIKLLEK